MSLVIEDGEHRHHPVSRWRRESALVVVQAKEFDLRRVFLSSLIFLPLYFLALLMAAGMPIRAIDTEKLMLVLVPSSVLLALIATAGAYGERKIKRLTIWIVDHQNVHVIQSGRLKESLPWSEIDALSYLHRKGRLMFRRRGTYQWVSVGPVSFEAYLRVEKLRAGIPSLLPGVLH